MNIYIYMYNYRYIYNIHTVYYTCLIEVLTVLIITSMICVPASGMKLQDLAGLETSRATTMRQILEDQSGEEKNAAVARSRAGGGWAMHAELVTRCRWPFQEPKPEVPTIYKAYIRPM